VESDILRIRPAPLRARALRAVTCTTQDGELGVLAAGDRVGGHVISGEVSGGVARPPPPRAHSPVGFDPLADDRGATSAFV